MRSIDFLQFQGKECDAGPSCSVGGEVMLGVGLRMFDKRVVKLIRITLYERVAKL